MSIKNKGLLSLLCVFLIACQNYEEEKKPTVVIKNDIRGSQLVQRISIPLNERYLGWQLRNVPSEWGVDALGNNVLYATVSVIPGQEQVFDLVPPSSADTTLLDMAHAELSIRTGGDWDGTVYRADNYSFEPVYSFESPSQLTDHSYYLRYEGPGWENDKIGYRLYLDWRNAIDVFAKTTTKNVLHQAGVDGYDSYHELADWGGDALKVGKSLGLGALGLKSGDDIMHFQYVDNTQWALIENSKTTAAFEVKYTQWRASEQQTNGIDVTTTYRINTGDASTHIQVDLSEPQAGIVAGLVAHDGMSFIEKTQDDWGVIATWGEQSVLSEGDKLGLAVFYPKSKVKSITPSKHDYLVEFQSTTQFDYYIMAVWPSHVDNIADQKAFERQLSEKLKALNYPLTIVKFNG